MYLNKKEHFLSDTLLTAAAVHILIILMEAAFRILMRRAGAESASRPDMENRMLQTALEFLTVVRIILIAAAFLASYMRLKKKLALFDATEQFEIAALQREVFGSDHAVLPGDTIQKLLLLWGFILIGVQAIYDVSSGLYRSFISQLSDITVQIGQQADFVDLYNFTHGFKYAGMLIAILLGVMATGIFLDDRHLMAAGCCVAAAYLLSFALLEMQSVSVMGRTVGIVWSSVIFHLLETIGITGLALYMRFRYLGL